MQDEYAEKSGHGSYGHGDLTLPSRRHLILLSYGKLPLSLEANRCVGEVSRRAQLIPKSLG